MTGLVALSGGPIQSHDGSNNMVNSAPLGVEIAENFTYDAFEPLHMNAGSKF
jgi:hypothetical protein